MNDDKPQWIKWVPFLAGLILQAFVLAVSWGALHAQVQENFRVNQEQNKKLERFVLQEEYDKRHEDMQQRLRDLEERVRDLERNGR